MSVFYLIISLVWAAGAGFHLGTWITNRKGISLACAIMYELVALLYGWAAWSGV